MRRIAAGVAAAVALCATVSVRGCGRGYSDGERVGSISKFSRRGLIAKTHEGEMVMGGLRTRSVGEHVVTEANVWSFTVISEDVAREVEAAMAAGKPVRVKYVQWLVGPALRMESDYEAIAVAEVAQ